MKMLVIRSLFLLLLLVAFAVGAWAQGPGYNVGVDGMACPFCVYGLEKQLQKLQGVEEVETDLEQGNVVVLMAKGKALERDEVKQAVNNAGFTLRSFAPTEAEKAP
jgi:mercuric ion binding protein